jgi:DNA-directed RNA polymerase specialized sigma24 family protein
MTGVWGPPQEPDEQALLTGARAGERAAVERLYALHLASARRLATILVGPAGADGLVAESFSRALGQLRAGLGPTTGFRAHLHTTMRNVYRARSGETSVVPYAQTVDGLDAAGSTAALASLPGGMQQALWHADVEGRGPHEVAELLGTTPARATSLVGRARERLHDAYLDRHGASTTTDDEKCQWTREHLGAYVRGDLGRRRSRKVADHLAGCSACTAAHAELTRLNPQLESKVSPIVLVGAMGAVDAAAEAAPGAVAADGPDQLLTELNARVAGKPVQEAAPAAGGVGTALGDLPGRTAITVAAAVLAVLAIAATSWGLARHQGEETAAPDNTDLTGVTFGPNAPSATPTPTFPTAPTVPSATLPTDTGLPLPSFPTAPTFPVLPTSTFPYPTSTVPYVPPPVYPTTTAPTTTPPTSSTPTVVSPVAPIATKISGCGTRGLVQVVETTGVRYDFIVGDGHEGRWVVEASAREGYKFAKGTATRFKGNVGKIRRCPTELRIRGVSATATVDDEWQVSVSPAVPKEEDRALSITYSFTTEVDVLGVGGDDWTCVGPDGEALGTEVQTIGSGAIDCTFAGQPSQAGPITLTVIAHDDDGDAVAPAGNVALFADGDEVDTAGFAGVIE